MTILGLALGYVAALVKGPRYVAEAVIAPKESDNQKMPQISGLNTLSGIIPISFSGNASLDKIQQVADSREFHARLVEHYNLLPEIYRHEWNKQYMKWFDISLRQWKPGFNPPRILDMGSFFKKHYVNINKDSKKNIIAFIITTKDSTFTDSLMAHYLEFLDLYIRTSVQNEANENVAYLNTRLDSISDPLLQEKVRGIIASELEKAMVVSKKAFKIIDVPYRSYAFKQKRLFPMIFSAGMMLLSLFAVVLEHAFASCIIVGEDRELFEKIKKELWIR